SPRLDRLPALAHRGRRRVHRNVRTMHRSPVHRRPQRPDSDEGLASSPAGVLMATVLIGPWCAGKSTHGPRLAAETSREFIDLDDTMAGSGTAHGRSRCQ